MVAESIGIGIVVGVVGVAAGVGLIKFIIWCHVVSERITQFDIDLELKAQRFDKKCMELDTKIKNEIMEVYRSSARFGEVTLDGFVVLNKRVDELEKAEKVIEEKPDDS